MLAQSNEERVVCVCDCVHGVDFEIFVRSVGRDHFDWTPVGESGLGVVEPVVGSVLDVSLIQVSNTLCDLGSWHSSA